jgi:hypothetical protein
LILAVASAMREAVSLPSLARFHASVLCSTSCVFTEQLLV